MSRFAADTLSFMLVNSHRLKKAIRKMRTKLQQHLTENNVVFFFFFLSAEIRVRFMAPTSTVQFLSKWVRQKKYLTHRWCAMSWGN